MLGPCGRVFCEYLSIWTHILVSGHMILFLVLDLFYFLFFNVYLFLRERNRAQAGEGQKERETQNPEAGSSLWAVSTEPNTGLEPMNHEIMTWAKVRRLADWATQALLPFISDANNLCSFLHPVSHQSSLNFINVIDLFKEQAFDFIDFFSLIFFHFQFHGFLLSSLYLKFNFFISFLKWKFR